MYRVDLGDVFGKSILYKDDEKVEQIKKINDHLTILHFLQEKKEDEKTIVKPLQKC